MGDGGGPWSEPWEDKQMGRQVSDMSLAPRSSQEYWPSDKRTSRALAGHVFKTLAILASLFHCLHVLGIGDAEDKHCTGLAGNVISVSVIIVVWWSWWWRPWWVSVMTVAVCGDRGGHSHGNLEIMMGMGWRFCHRHTWVPS